MKTTALLRLSLFALSTLLVVPWAAAKKINPTVEHAIRPNYPDELWKTGVEGQAVVQATISETGAVDKAEIVSADNPAFGEAALAAVKQWKFKPATQDGNPVSSNVQLPVVFSIPGEQKFNIEMGREVFMSIIEPVVPEANLDHPMKVVKPPVAVWPGGIDADPYEVQVLVKLVVGPTGETFNPEIADNSPRELWLPAMKAAAQMTCEPPLLDGKPVYALTEAIVLFVDAPAASGQE
ncbi:MAG TPA: TonB family protein [Opitutaceae bacterium]|nr:TonB family protein [Opitutaceae bacterium]